MQQGPLQTRFLSNTLQEKALRKKKSQENTWLTVPCVFVVSLLYVNNAVDSNNEGGKEPNHEDHEFREMFWRPTAVDNHT